MHVWIIGAVDLLLISSDPSFCCPFGEGMCIWGSTPGLSRGGGTHECQGAVAAHAVPRDAHAAGVQLLEVREQRRRQLVRDVARHTVALVPRRLGRVDVEAGAAAEVVGVVFASDVEASWNHRARSAGIFHAPPAGVICRGDGLGRGRVRTRAGVRVHDGDAALRGAVLEEALLGAVVARAGEAGEEEEHGHFVQGVEGCGWGEEEVQRHVAGGGFGRVGELQELAAEGGDGGFGLESHGGWEEM